MKQISLDFRNRMLAIRTDGQDGSEVMAEDIEKKSILPFLPKKEMYLMADNFTFDFEANTVSINQDVDFENKGNAIYSVAMFIPVTTYAAPGLDAQFHKIIDALGYAEVHWNEREMDYLDTMGFLNSLMNK